MLATNACVYVFGCSFASDELNCERLFGWLAGWLMLPHNTQSQHSAKPSSIWGWFAQNTHRICYARQTSGILSYTANHTEFDAILNPKRII